MKKITFAIILMVLAVTLIGCGNNIVKKSIEQANTAIKSKNYDKALVALELALDEDNANEEAKKLYSILEGYQKVKSALEDNNIDEAKKVLDGIDGEYINYAIKEDIDLLKNQVQEKFKEVEVINNNISKLEALIWDNKYDEAKTLTEEVNKSLLNEEQKNKINTKVDSELAKKNNNNERNISANNTNTTNTQQTAKTQEQKVSYKQYVNARYGFSIEYPDNFTVKTDPENGDGLSFQSADGKTEITVSGINNVLDDTVISAYNDLRLYHSNASYKKQQGNWFVVSWLEGDSIVYEKRIIGNGSENTLLIKYPTSQKDYYNDIVPHLVETFKSGEINSGH